MDGPFQKRCSTMGENAASMSQTKTGPVTLGLGAECDVGSVTNERNQVIEILVLLLSAGVTILIYRRRTSI